MNWAIITWTGLLVLFLIVEAACPLHLVSIWFAVGSLAAILTTWLGGPVWLQVAVFLAVSAVLLAALWPLVRKYLNPKLTATNLDALPGTAGLVTVAIDNVAAVGQVKLNGMEWTARSTSGAPIPLGAKVTVDRIEGVKAFVSPAEVPAKV